MSDIISKRSELLFCYDVTDANPNGDPLDNNRPRIDEETGINIVTDVRLKRTVRDYLHDYKDYNGKDSKDIFVREIVYDEEKGFVQDGKMRAKDFQENAKNIVEKCIDIRLFGGVIPMNKDSITYTGPVQFKIGRSLHQVEIKHIKGTGAFASKEGSKQKTFREEYILPYSFIVFHGIVNETAAGITKLTEDDVDELIEALWDGTKNLISRSKFGQMPRLLIKVTYKNKGFFIGDLDKKIKMTGFENPLKVRSENDFIIDISELLNSFDTNKNEINGVEYKIDDNLRLEQQIPDGWKKFLQ